MHYDDILQAMALKGIRLATVGEKFGCSRQNVRQLFFHKDTKSGKPSLMRKYIAEILEKRYEEVWGE